MLKLFNTLTRKKEEFIPRGVTVKIYFCGPTVYNYAHIGNLRAYIFPDLLRRYLEYRGFVVRLIMNITDVDDKTIRDSKKEGLTLKQFTDKYTKAFFEDIDALKIRRASHYPKATEHIKEMADIINKLFKNGLAYKSEDGSIYFNISKFKKYGKLSGLKIKELKPGTRVKQDEYTKEQVQDFALWKAWTVDDGDVYWDIKIGKEIIRGRPGWHIECSAMSEKHLGLPIDIHGGGVDLIFPHHENEIAQTIGSGEKEFVRYWIHGEHLIVDGKKMSKSLGNFYTLRDLIKRDYDPLAFRFLCMNSHYRNQLNFTFQALEDAEKTLETINDFFYKLEDYSKWVKEESNEFYLVINEIEAKFEEAMDDDFNSAEALPVIFELMSIVNKMIDNKTIDRKALKLAKNFLLKINTIFDFLKPKEELTDVEKELLQKREQARLAKDYEKSDHYRAKLRKMGVILEDTPYGTRWRKTKFVED